MGNYKSKWDDFCDRHNGIAIVLSGILLLWLGIGALLLAPVAGLLWFTKEAFAEGRILPTLGVYAFTVIMLTQMLDTLDDFIALTASDLDVSIKNAEMILVAILVPPASAVLSLVENYHTSSKHTDNTEA